MTIQTSSPIVHHTLPVNHNRAKQWTRAADEGLLDLNPPYQRGAVWCLSQRQGLVRSWLSGTPIPAIILNDRGTQAWQRTHQGISPLDTGKNLYAVIDGKQRLLCAIAWFAGEFAVPASWFDADFVETPEDSDDGPYVTYLGLTETGRRIFDNHAMLPVAEAKVATEADEAAIYLLVNGAGTPQTDADMANAARVAADSYDPAPAAVEQPRVPVDPATAAWSGMFVGHWEDDEIVVEYVLPVDEQDHRVDEGFWEQGLFAAPGYGADYADALAGVRAEYANR